MSWRRFLLCEPQAAHPGLLAASRIAFSLLTLVAAWRSWQLRDLYFYNISSQPGRDLLTLLHLLWILGGGLLLVGLGGRLAGTLQLAASLLLMRNYPTVGAYEMLHLLNSLLFTVARADEKYSLNIWLWRKLGPRAWLLPPVSQETGPVTLILIHFSLLFAFNGLTKATDPLWANGWGFAYYCNLPYTLPDGMRAASQSEELMWLFNWVSIFCEVAFPLLVLWPLTRKLGLFLAAALFVGLTYPFNFYLIGPLGLSLLIGLASVAFTRAANSGSSPPLWKRALCLTYPLSLVILFSHSAYWFYQVRPKAPAPAYVPVQDLNELSKDFFTRAQPNFRRELREELRLGELLYPHRFLYDWLLRPYPQTLFTSSHLAGVFAYRVEVRLTDGRVLEPVAFYRPDQGRTALHSQPFNSNALQCSMYPVSNLVHMLSFRKELPFLRHRYEKYAVAPLLQLGLARAQVPADSVSEVVLRVSEMEQPPRPNPQWLDLVAYLPSSQQYRYLNWPTPSLAQGRLPGFPNYLHQ